MHNPRDKYPARSGFEPCTSECRARTGSHEPSGPADMCGKVIPGVVGGTGTDHAVFVCQFNRHLDPILKQRVRWISLQNQHELSALTRVYCRAKANSSNCLHPYAAELFRTIFHSFAAGIAYPIFSFKWRKIIIFMQKSTSLKCHY